VRRTPASAVVMLAVDACARAIVLADGLDGAGVVEEAAVLDVAEPERAHVMIEDGVGVAGDQALRTRWGLQEERPVPADEGQGRVGPRPHLAGGHDVEDGYGAHSPGMVQRHPVRDAPAAVVPRAREPLMAQPRHGLHLFQSQRALGVRARRRPRRAAVAGQVGRDDREAVRQPRGGHSPHPMRLRIPVQQQQRRPAAADAGEDHSSLRVELLAGETLKHPFAPCRARRAGRR
jgi:hypothetical protein